MSRCLYCFMAFHWTRLINTIIRDEDPTIRKRLEEKYERIYHLYADGEYLGSVMGEIYEENTWGVDTPDIKNKEDKGEVAISRKFDPYPRKPLYMKTGFPAALEPGGKVILSVNQRFNVSVSTREICIIDLDGDSIDEYIAYVVDTDNYFMAVLLINSEYNIVSYLSVLMEEFDSFSDFVVETIDSDMEIIDIDNDGVMEILVIHPLYNDFAYRLFSYKNGIFYGKYLNRGTYSYSDCDMTKW